MNNKVGLDVSYFNTFLIHSLNNLLFGEGLLFFG